MYRLKINDIAIVKNSLVMSISIFRNAKNNGINRIAFTLDDLTENSYGEILEDNCSLKSDNYIVKFYLTDDFSEFHDAKLTVNIESVDNDYVELPVIIYSLDSWEILDEDYSDFDFEEYENNLVKSSNDILRKQLEEIKEYINIPFSEDEKQCFVDLNGYNDSWINIELTDYSIDFASSGNLFAEFQLTYTSNYGNVLNQLEFYISTISGSKIDYSGYLTRDGAIPNKIDIWLDNKKHILKFGPTFNIKKDDENIRDGIRLTVSFKDIKQSYYVRKSYVFEDGFWYHEELFAIPIKQFE